MSTEHVIVFPNAGPIETKKLLNSLAIVRLSFTVSLLISFFFFNCPSFFPIMDFNIFHAFLESF